MALAQLYANFNLLLSTHIVSHAALLGQNALAGCVLGLAAGIVISELIKAIRGRSSEHRQPLPAKSMLVIPSPVIVKEADALEPVKQSPSHHRNYKSGTPAPQPACRPPAASSSLAQQ